MNIEGIFEQSMGPLINSTIEKDRIMSVVNHESVHRQLGTDTTYGQLMIMLHKNGVFDSKSKKIYDELFEHVRRMQERTAVNIELLSCYMTNGKEAYRNAIESLKERNRTYYNYFRKLCCINGRVHSKEDAGRATLAIMAIALLAMNIDLDQVPFEEFYDCRSVKRFFSIRDNNIKYNPNFRFDALVDRWFREKGNKVGYDQILEGTIALEDLRKIDIIHGKAERAAIRIFSDSPIKNRLMQRIATVGTPINVGQYEGAEFLTFYPEELNKKKIEPKVIPLDFASFQDKLSKKNIKELIIPHQIGGFEDLYTCLIRDDMTINTYYVLALSDEYSFLRTLQKLNCKTIFLKTKLVKKYHKSLKQVISKIPIFICYDSPIINALDFIKEFYWGGKYYFIIQEGYLLLVIYKKSFFAIFKVMKEAKKCIEEILSEDHILLSEKPDFSDQVEGIWSRIIL